MFALLHFNASTQDWNYIVISRNRSLSYYLCVLFKATNLSLLTALTYVAVFFALWQCCRLRQCKWSLDWSQRIKLGVTNNIFRSKRPHQGRPQSGYFEAGNDVDDFSRNVSDLFGNCCRQVLQRQSIIRNSIGEFSLLKCIVMMKYHLDVIKTVSYS